MDPNMYTPPKRSTADQVAGLGMFADVVPAAPTTPAPRPAPPAPALHHDNANSQALESKLRVRAGTNGDTILRFLHAQGEHTRKEIAAATGIPINVVTPCVVALRKHGHILELDGLDGRPHRTRAGGNLLRAMR